MFFVIHLVKDKTLLILLLGVKNNKIMQTVSFKLILLLVLHFQASCGNKFPEAVLLDIALFVVGLCILGKTFVTTEAIALCSKDGKPAL